MDDRVRTLFLAELRRQCQFVLIACSDLDSAIASHDGDRVWYSVQALLVAVGNISKILWPTPPLKSKKQPKRERSATTTETETRGADLRSLLGVSDDSTLQPRTFRNHFEHFDHRLEAWATSSARRNFIDSNVGSGIVIGGVDPGDYVRNLDTQKHVVTFRGDAYALAPVLQAVRDLLAALQQQPA